MMALASILIIGHLALKWFVTDPIKKINAKLDGKAKEDLPSSSGAGFISYAICFTTVIFVCAGIISIIGFVFELLISIV